MKKTLKTVGLSVLITTFVTSIIYFALISYLNNQILDLYYKSYASINTNIELATNTCKNIEDIYRNLETNALDSFEFNTTFDPDIQLPEDFPKLGLGLATFLFPIAFSFTRYLSLIFISAIVSGIAIGLLIDAILIKKKKGKKLLLSIFSTLLICLVTATTFLFIQTAPTVYEIGIIELLFASLSSSLLFIEFFVLIFLIIYIVNYIQQLNNIKKLNKELNSTTDTKKLKNKIILLISIPLAFIILLAILDYFLPFTPVNELIYNSFILETFVDLIENIFSFFENLYYNFFPIEIGG